MKITFTYFVVTNESIELGIFLDHGLYNPVTKKYYSAQDFDSTKKEDYEYVGTFYEALNYALDLKCTNVDIYPVYFNGSLSFSSLPPEKINGEHICHRITFQDMEEKDFVYVCKFFNVEGLLN